MPTPTDAAVAPTIASDLADYAPGGTVTLTGLGWRAGESVTIVVNDTGGLSWSLNQQVVADGEGRFTLTFALPNYYVPDYDVTATGALSGVATTTFTDGATGFWQWWMTDPTPTNGGSVGPGATIAYKLNAQKTTTSTTGFSDAAMTLTLVGNATFTGPTTPLGTNLGSITGIGTNTLTWTGMNLDRTGTGINNTRTITVTATVPTSASAGTVIATANDVNDTNGGFYNGSISRLAFTTHTVTDPVTHTCDFADAGSGAYASSICWFDLNGYNATTAASVNGQTMRQTLPDDYTLTYTIKVGSSDAAAAAKAFPTWTGSYLGNPNSGVGGYQGITGMPAIYQSAGGTTTLALSKIGLTDRSGAKVSGFALVGADAESTDDNEWITWTSNVPFTSVGPLGNACGGGFTGNLTTTVNCTGGIGVGSKNGAAIIYSKDPTTFTQSMKGTGLQGVAFGVMVSGLQLNKRIVNMLPGDQFSISVARADKTVVATAITDPATGSAKTKPVYAISAGAAQTFTLSEAPVGSALAANYATTWVCNANGEFTSGIGPLTTAAMDLKDIVECTFTNTGPTLTLKKVIDNTGGGTLKPEDWILTAKSASATVIAAAPSATTGSTATVPVPVGSYTLAESSSAAGAGRYLGGDWTCTNGVVVTQNVISMAAGKNVTCTITNTFVPKVTIRNTWVNGVSGDKADLVISKGPTALGQAISTSNGNPGSFLDALNVASATPVVDDLITVTESMKPTNSGSYTTTLVGCVKGLNVPVVVSGGQFTMPNSDVTCDFSTRPTAGTVTWSKVDAGSTSTLLTGSEWTLTGPNYPLAGLAIADCTVAPCSGPDTDPVAGQFTVAVLCGTCTLVEKTAPVGFQVDGTRWDVIIADGQVRPLGAIANKRAAVPALPLSGGASSDAFVLVGYALIAAAGFAARRHRRRSLRL